MDSSSSKGRFGALFVCLLLSTGCSYSTDEEVDIESAAVQAHLPIGTPFSELPAAMQKLGYACTAGHKQFRDAKGRSRDAESHLACVREETYWLVCRKRTRAILLQFNGRLSHALVNHGRFCF